MENWFEESPLDNITLSQLEELCLVTLNKRNEIEDVKKVLKDKDLELDALENKIMAILEKFGKSSYKSEYATFYTSESLMVTQPNTPDKKEMFRNYLKENNLEDMLSVNSNTLRSFVKAQREGYISEGKLPPSIPGIEEPQIVKKLSMRRGK